MHVNWLDIAIRLALTIAASFVIGFDRGEHGRPAGLRTTILVAVAACMAMLQADLLLPTVGKPSDSYVVLDLMRLPLGILSGIGFIGAGAIVRRENLVLGVTTAATLWFVTVLGLCFGGGQLGLGAAGATLGFGVLTILRHVDRRMRRDRHATCKIVTRQDGPSEEEIRSVLQLQRYEIQSSAAVYWKDGTMRLTFHVKWRTDADDTKVPAIAPALAQRAGIERVVWNSLEQ